MRQRARRSGPCRARSAAIRSRGEALFIQYGCGSCHALKNVRSATGSVGPPLDGIALRVIIGGHLANTPDNMQRWIRDPQHVAPGTAMPDLNVGGDAPRHHRVPLHARQIARPALPSDARPAVAEAAGSAR